MIGLPTKSYYIVKYQIQTLVDVQVLQLCTDQKIVTANITIGLHIREVLAVPTEVEQIPAAELLLPTWI